jgi:NADH:ubiquinone oxidoreductase subunit H
LYFGLKFLFYVVIILFSVVFVTLLERKVIGSLNERIRPNWVFYFGLLQSVVDGLKLAAKGVMLIAFKSEMKKDFVMSVLLMLILFFFT